MSKLLSVKLEDEVFRATEKILRGSKLPLSRNSYINRAVRFFNRLHERRRLRAELQRESALVREGSLAVLAEFEGLSDPGA